MAPVAAAGSKPDPERAPAYGPWSDALAVSGVGLATCLGGAVQACAAARASLSGVATLDGYELWDPDDCEVLPATGCPVASIDGFSGVARLASLAAAGLSDLLSDGRGPERTGVFLAVGSGWHFDARDALAEETDAAPRSAGPGSPPSDARELTSAVADRLVPTLRALLPLAAERYRLFAGDAPGFAVALEAARASLRAGELDRCIVGGVDSYVEAEHLAALDAVGLLKGPRSATGVLPGEGAAFLMVEAAASVRRRGARALALVNAAAFVTGSGSARDEAFAKALGTVLDGERSGIGLVVADLDGSTHRATAWGTILVRRRELHSAPQWYPAMHFGALGAAAGPAAACMIVRGFERGYAPAGDALAWLWGERGTRAAFRMRRAGTGSGG